jgi:hypothetical protein
MKAFLYLTIIFSTIFNFTNNKRLGCEDMVEFNNDVDTLLVKLRNYCFTDSTCTGFLEAEHELLGDALAFPNDRIVKIYKVEGEGKEKVTPVNVKSATDQDIINQFILAVSIAYQFQRTTNDKNRKFVSSYFFLNQNTSKPIYDGYFQVGSSVPIQIKNLEHLKFINFSATQKVGFQNNRAYITFSGQEPFSIVMDSIFYSRKFKWVLDGEKIPKPTPKRH